MKNKFIDLYQKALSEKINRNFVKSKKIFNTLLSTDKSLEAKFHLSQIYMLENNFSYAKSYIEEMIQKEYELPTNLNNYAAILSYEKKYEEAITYYKKALKFRPNDLYVEKSMAYNYRLNKQFKESEEIYKKILNKNPLDISNIINISNLYFKLGKKFLGLKFLLKAQQVDKTNYEVIYNLIQKLPYFKIKYKKYLELLKKIVPKNFINSKEILNKYNTNKIKLASGESNKKSLKFGFISGDFFSHPVSFFLLDFLKILKTYDVQIYLISDKNNEDQYTREIKKKLLRVVKNRYHEEFRCC